MTIVQTTHPAKKVFDYNLEALRGFAALAVVWHHMVNEAYLLDPRYHPTGVASFGPPGHAAVLVFFLLSGYVIELSTKAPLTRVGIPIYIRKRFLRIYPIYFVALLLALLVAPNSYSWSAILTNFTFTQIPLTQTIVEINPAWSLAYEIGFYLLFIPLSYFKMNPALVAASAFVVGLTNLVLGAHVPLLTSFTFGLTFWLTGLLVARYFRDRPTRNVTYSELLSGLLLFLCLIYFNVFITVLTKVENSSQGHLLYPKGIWEQQAIAFQDFAYLPYCLFFLLLFTAKEYKYRRLTTVALMLVPLYTFRYLIITYGMRDLSAWTLPIIFYLLSLLLYLFPNFVERVAEWVIQRFVLAGSISYGIYIIHFQLLAMLHQISYFTGAFSTYALRFVMVFILSVVTAKFLEQVYQPWVLRRIRPETVKKTPTLTT